MPGETRKKKVVGIGELLWDLLPDGKKLGGAPANFAYHAQMLGAHGFVISVIGNDSLGKEIIDQLNDINIDTNYIKVSNNHPTGTVTVRLDECGNPDFIIDKNVAWDYISFSQNIKDLVGGLDAICFGSLAQRSEISRNSIRQIIDGTSEQCLRIFDVNLRQNYYTIEIIDDSLRLANCFKLNEDELPVVANILSISGSEQEILNEFLNRFELRIIALTKGKQGSILHTLEESSFLESTEVEVVDSVGAGDAFTAALTLGLLRKLPLETIHEQAIKLSAYVCTQSGATPVLTESMQKQLVIYRDGLKN